MLGQLNQRVTVLRYSEQDVGDRGNSKGQWVAKYEDVPAKVDALSGREAEQARQLVSEAQYKVTMRYHPGVRVGYRIAWASALLEVAHVDNPGNRNLQTIILCTKIAQDDGEFNNSFSGAFDL